MLRLLKSVRLRLLESVMLRLLESIRRERYVEASREH